jgi:hypothetical protein
VLSRVFQALRKRPDRNGIERALQELAAAERQRTATLDARLKSLSDLVAQRSTGKDANEILHAVRALVRVVEEGAVGGAADGEKREWGTKVFRALDLIARGDGPIIVGPWTGEVGFEVLYWIPFLEWFRARWHVSPDRLVLVSRGGVESWYGMPGARYVDIFSVVSPATFLERADRDERRRVSQFDRDLFDAVVTRCGVEGAAHLHPQMMYQALSPFWKDEAGFGLITRFTTHRRLEPIDAMVSGDLPDDFVAVRFYFSNCFPDKPKNRAVAQAVVDALAEQRSVVVLDSGVRVDDHADYAPDQHGRVIRMPTGAADRNLAVQSAVLSRARAFVGTYGGYSYLAPFYGVPSVGFYSKQSFKLHHLYAAQRALERLGTANVVAVNVAHADVVHAATAASQWQGSEV